MFICLCKGITEDDFLDLTVQHNGSWEGVKTQIGLNESCCGRCEVELKERLAEMVQTDELHSEKP